MSTSMSYFSSMRLKMTRADFESSTTSERLRAMGIVYRSLFDAFSAPQRNLGQAPPGIRGHRNFG
jgi:hypothetical protein